MVALAGVRTRGDVGVIVTVALLVKPRLSVTRMIVEPGEDGAVYVEELRVPAPEAIVKRYGGTPPDAPNMTVSVNLRVTVEGIIASCGMLILLPSTS